MTMKTYSELMSIPDYYDRFDYLRLDGKVGELTFGYERYLNQALYRSSEWQALRPHVIARDDAKDMGHPDFEIPGRIIIHHINPITIEMIIHSDPLVFDPENLICVAHNTHEAIHYGDKRLLPQPLIERKKGDTTLWRR